MHPFGWIHEIGNTPLGWLLEEEQIAYDLIPVCPLPVPKEVPLWFEHPNGELRLRYGEEDITSIGACSGVKCGWFYAFKGQALISDGFISMHEARLAAEHAVGRLTR